MDTLKRNMILRLIRFFFPEIASSSRISLIWAMTFLCIPVLTEAAPGNGGQTGLFHSMPVPAGPVALPSKIRREGYVQFDRTLLDGLPSRFKHPGWNPGFKLNLFDDVQVEWSVERLRVRPKGGWVVWGSIPGQETGRVIMAYRDGILQADVWVPGHNKFEVRYLQNGLHLISETNPAPGQVLLDGGPEKAGPTGAEWVASQGVPTFYPQATQSGCPNSQSLKVSQIMVLYTALAAENAGGAEALETLIDMDWAGMNMAFYNSGVTAEMELVATQPVTYLETGDVITDLGNLTNAAYFPQLGAWMATYGANYVSLFVGSAATTTGGGIVAGVGQLPGFATVCYYPYADIAFSHEVGHNMGCHHDRQTDDVPSGNGFNYGYRFASGGTTFITIMAYQPGNWILNYSNPAVNFMGQPTGVDPASVTAADNALEINQNFPNTPYTGAYPLPTVQISSPLTGSYFPSATPITFTALASDTGGTVGQVDFMVNDLYVGTSTTSPYTLVWTPPSAGTYYISADAINNQGGMEASCSNVVYVSEPTATVTPTFTNSFTPTVTMTPTVTLTFTPTATSGSPTSTATTTATATMTATLGPAPPPWTDQDIGAVPAAGTALFDGSNYYVSGSGNELNTGTDAFNFLWQPLCGNGAITAVSYACASPCSSTFTTNDKTGLMIRSGLSADAPFVMVSTVLLDYIELTYRGTAGAVPSVAVSLHGIGQPIDYALVQSGNTYTAYIEELGTWSSLGSATVTLTAPLEIGLVESSDQSTLVTMGFGPVEVNTGGCATMTPTFSSTPTFTPSPTATLTLIPTATGTLPTATATGTATSTPSATGTQPTATFTSQIIGDTYPVFTNTFSPTVTSTFTASSTPTLTFSPTMTTTSTATFTFTSTTTMTLSLTPTLTPAGTPTNSLTSTPTSSAIFTNTATLTSTTTMTPTSSPTRSATNTLTETFTSSITLTPTQTPPLPLPTATLTPTISLTPFGIPTPAMTEVVIGPPYPNPIEGGGPVSLDFQSPPGANLIWDVFTIAFRKVMEGSQPLSGKTFLSWDLKDKDGIPVSDGLYYIRVKAIVGNSQTIKIFKVLIVR